MAKVKKITALLKRKRDTSVFRIIVAVMLFIVILGAVFVVFTRYSNEQNIVYETPINLSAIKYLEDPKVDCTNGGEIEYLSYKKLNSNQKFKQNNKFGLYVYAEDREFLSKAAELVNSNGGDWGYVLIPYNMTDRDSEKWDKVFETLLDKHLVPIIQLNALTLNEYENQTVEAAKFLDSLVWPVKDRYISVYNEPNDSKFWYEKADAAQYAEILKYTIETFKDQNQNFFMINGALNVSASPGGGYVDAFVFMRQMNEAEPGIFEMLDGWASHPYPQPNFSGSPTGFGRWSVRAYEEELRYLDDFFNVTDLPVFITETGWAHAEGEKYNSSYLPVDQVAKNFVTAYEQVWLKDDRVVAVTPFTVWYPPPFDHFSWLNEDKVPYKHFEVVKSMDKEAGIVENLVSSTTTLNVCGY